MITSSKEYFGEGIGIILKTKNFLFDVYITTHFRLRLSSEADSQIIILLLWIGPFAFEVTRNVQQEYSHLNDLNKIIEDSLE